MTATDELRRMLDERGVFWIDIPLVNMKRTCWKSSEEQDGYCYFDEDAFGVTELTVTSITPAQAIAATLGAGTCEADETDLIPFVPANGDASEVDYIRVMECSSCGGTFEHVNGSYEFCPRCGRRIEVDGCE